ncbi:hypothetical protein BDY24DRAFT_444366 [Mrakia frigida]|uniref:Zn(II)2Cys6 transcription factor domain-containing protein n=1 Tax=Mrakia frigida TaxID=29902 RepID=UPI003FCC077F
MEPSSVLISSRPSSALNAFVASSSSSSSLDPISYYPSTAAPFFHPSFYPSTSTMEEEEDLNYQPNVHQFGSAHSSSSSSLPPSHLLVEERCFPPSLQDEVDYSRGYPSAVIMRGGNSTNGYKGDDVFNPFDFDQPNTTSRPPLQHRGSSTSSSVPSSSNSSLLPPPTPLDISGWNPGQWESLDPVLKSEERSAGDAQRRGKKTAEFTMVRSVDSSRTPQACEACRLRKSKCDGKPSCVRCEKKGAQCVYVARSRLRGKQNRRYSSLGTLPISSLLTTHPLAPQSTTTSVGCSTNPGARLTLPRRKTSDGTFGMGGQREEDNADPTSLFDVPAPFGSLPSASPYYHHTQSYQFNSTHHSYHSYQHSQPPPLPQPTQQQHQLFDVAPPPVQYSPSPSFQPSSDLLHSYPPTLTYSPFTVPTTILHHTIPPPPPPPLEPPSSLLFAQQPDASRSRSEVDLNKPSSSSSSSYHHPTPTFPSVLMAPTTTSYSHLGLMSSSPQPALDDSVSSGKGGIGIATPVQQVWDRGGWEEVVGRR